jgi:hypothetical protein
LAALPRLRRGQGWVRVPSNGVLAQVAFPRIRIFDSSATPRREERVAAPGGLTIGDGSCRVPGCCQAEELLVLLTSF